MVHESWDDVTIIRLSPEYICHCGFFFTAIATVVAEYAIAPTLLKIEQMY
ncbi:MAG: hypothetical protein RIE73_31765 [Coleofasciculus sp. C1-SOL-03]